MSEFRKRIDVLRRRAQEDPGMAYLHGSDATLHALRALFAEREQQHEKWGEQNHSPEIWYVILGEEFGEVAQAILEIPHAKDFEGAVGELEMEITQVCAVAFQWLEALERGKAKQ